MSNDWDILALLLFTTVFSVTLGVIAGMGITEEKYTNLKCYEHNKQLICRNKDNKLINIGKLEEEN